MKSGLPNDVNSQYCYPTPTAPPLPTQILDDARFTKFTKIATNILVDVALIGTIIGAVAASANIVGLTCLTIVAVIFGAASISTAIAAFQNDTDTPNKYFEKVGASLKVAIPGAIKFVAQVLLQALIAGLGKRIETAVAGEASRTSHLHIHQH
jgi:hypothetical protein